jgi:predicted small secreted protein
MEKFNIAGSEPIGRPRDLEKAITMFKKIMLMLAVMSLGSPLLLTGCNTVQGAGKDISKAGDEIQEEAAEHKD